jgi:hypothetical protein
MRPHPAKYLSHRAVDSPGVARSASMSNVWPTVRVATRLGGASWSCQGRLWCGSPRCDAEDQTTRDGVMPISPATCASSVLMKATR